MINKIKNFFKRDTDKANSEIDRLRTELAILRSMADDE